MIQCTKCGKDVIREAEYCGSCGSRMDENGSHVNALAGKRCDADENKNWAILAYIIFLIPLLAAPKSSEFVRYHTNQGLVLAIASVCLSIVINLISSIITGIVSVAIPYSMLFVGSLFSVLWFAYFAAAFGMMIRGIITASKGKMEPLPVIGKFKILTK